MGDALLRFALAAEADERPPTEAQHKKGSLTGCGHE
jgi:hypothetical protein